MAKVLVLSVLFCLGLAWANETPEVRTIVISDEELIQVTTSLIRYQFAKNGGVLRSAYVYWAEPVETVPGWSGTTLGPGVSLPLEVWVDDSPKTGAYVVHTEGKDRETVILEASFAEEGLRVAKKLVLRKKALYTGEFAVEVEAAGLIRLVFGHLPGGADAPSLVYLYDGKIQKAPVAPGAYAKFQGVGLISGRTVFFFRIDEGNVQPFLAKNAQGQPVFGVEAKDSLRLRGLIYTGRNRYIPLADSGFAPLAQAGPYSRLLVGVIRFFEGLYRVTGNYGWAIILFTVITRILLHPLMRNQFRSMAKMQKLMPKMRKIQERFKDDRETLQKQMMELFRQEKVNPLGGCLLLLLQMPIMFILWQAIMYSAEKIRLSPGFLWIPDLSQPDPYYLLVILGTGTQILCQWYIQRRMPSQVGGGLQYLFPLLIAVFLLSFPAGAWLYWTLTNLVQMGQQLVIDWEIAREGAKAKDGGESS